MRWRSAVAVMVSSGFALTLASCGSAPSRADSPFCREVRALQAANPFVPGGSATAIGDGAAVLDRLVASAPVSIKDDVRVLRQAVNDLSEAGAGSALSVLANPEVVSAGRAVAEVAQVDCEVTDLFGVGTSTDG